jgi:hypothetical protein
MGNRMKAIDVKSVQGLIKLTAIFAFVALTCLVKAIYKAFIGATNRRKKS